MCSIFLMIYRVASVLLCLFTQAFTCQIVIQSLMKVILGICGSVAACRTQQIVELLLKNSCQVIVVATKSSLHFVPEINTFCLEGNANNLEATPSFFTDDAEWFSWKKRGDVILHIALRNWADVCVIAPLSANTMGKIASGMCDNLLTCVVRAWNMNKSIIVCPAMNTEMWINPITHMNCKTLESIGIKIMQPVEKQLMCGQKGIGGMASVEDIVATILMNGQELK